MGFWLLGPVFIFLRSILNRNGKCYSIIQEMKNKRIGILLKAINDKTVVKRIIIS